ncbi:MAG: hypothetical protein SOY65_03820 [Marinifilaceae bacterium]|nr:hypothetical protein [Marinifilaceae bacterium]
MVQHDARLSWLPREGTEKARIPGHLPLPSGGKAFPARFSETVRWYISRGFRGVIPGCQGMSIQESLAYYLLITCWTSYEQVITE